jgi:hypothetical protein
MRRLDYGLFEGQVLECVQSVVMDEDADRTLRREQVGGMINRLAQFVLSRLFGVIVKIPALQIVNTNYQCSQLRLFLQCSSRPAFTAYSNKETGPFPCRKYGSPPSPAVPPQKPDGRRGSLEFGRHKYLNSNRLGCQRLRTSIFF